MSAQNSTLSAQYIVIYEEATAINLCTLVATALLVYDVLLTSGQEYQYVWRSPRTWFSRALYLWNRYMSLFYFPLALGTVPSVSDLSCAALGRLASVVQILTLFGPAIFTTLRIYALSRKNRIVGGVALALGMAPFVINASTVYQDIPINLPAPLNCQSHRTKSANFYVGLVIASRSCMILVESLAVAVTWRQTRVANQLRTGMPLRPSLEQVMWGNGAAYFCILVSLNVADMILTILSITIQPGAEAYIAGFIDPVSSILNSRFLLDLHETNARLEGADASMTSYSLHIDSGGDPKTGSPELPPFLDCIGGPIHSFPDDDQTSLDFAPLSREEPIPDPEADLGSSGAGEEPA